MGREGGERRTIIVRGTTSNGTRLFEIQQSGKHGLIPAFVKGDGH